MAHDIVALIQDGHARLAELARGLRACARPHAALGQFNEFAVLLGAHLSVIRRVVYPALKSIGWKNVNSSLLLGHAKLTQAFAELLSLKKTDGDFADALADLLDATDWLVGLERVGLLALLRDNFSEGTRLAMAAEAAHFMPHGDLSATTSAADPARLSSRDWIEQARLLMGGMRPADQEPTP